jgi:NAD(P)-dependent dehydrogenase (short-subunit alcohol dehydrogenase family)
MEINDRVALVTGGASGIGRTTALALAASGASVTLVDVDEAGARETKSWPTAGHREDPDARRHRRQVIRVIGDDRAGAILRITLSEGAVYVD